jgi:hypothetical protein
MSALDPETLEVIGALSEALHAALSDLQQIHGGKTPKIATAALKRAGEFVRSRSDRVRYSK